MTDIFLKRGFKLIIGMLIVLIFSPALALSEEAYVFERMWPALQQPWYFSEFKLAVDKNDYIYIFNEKTKAIEKLSADGNFIHKWNTPVSGDGRISNTDLMMFTVDNEGFVYILDITAGRIHKFTANGEFVSNWETTQCQFESGYDNQGDIIADDQGYIYASDRCAMSITKFTSNGQFVTKWGSIGDNDGQFQQLKAITIDKGLLYAGDRATNTISIFTLDGQFIKKWSATGVDNDNLLKLFSMKVDKNGLLHVNTDFGKIAKYTLDGVFIEAWSKEIAREIVIDSKGYIYLNNYYGILKLTDNGNIIAQWESRSTENGKFNEPVGIAVDGDGYVYIAEEGNGRVQKFTSDGQYITKWDAGLVMAIATDKNGFVYTADGSGGYIRKFTSDGIFVKKWEVPGAYANGYVYFTNPSKISIDIDGYVYIFLPLQNQWPLITIFKFTSDGELVTSWESSGHPMYQQSLFNPMDSFGNYYLIDYDNFIKKYSNSGQLLSTFGGTGVVPGKFVGVFDLSITPNGMIYAVDTANNRIQVFRQVTTSSRNKTIIVAGGGPYPGNNLWNATQMSANFAFRTLTYQGFTKESIHYLTSDTNLDLDSNGVLDDVDGDSTNANLQQAITSWAADAENLIIYLVNHGGDGTFRMSGAETLSAAQLDSWIDQLQATIPGKVTVIYDACESGSFVSALTPPAGKERIVIGSTSPGESAYFVNQGSVSFSSYFWTHVFNGMNLNEAFSLAKESLSYTTAYQNPLLDANGNGLANEAEDLNLAQSLFIGNGTVIQGDSPVIGSVSPDQFISNTSSALLYADNVTDANGIARVWATVRPPSYAQAASTNTVNELPSFEFLPVGGDRWEATWNGFSIPGTYHLAIYARDRIGNTAVPKITTVSVNNPLRHKAVIVAASWQADGLWPAVEKNTLLAYNTLKFQGYSDEDIYVMAPQNIAGLTVDGQTTAANFYTVLSSWAPDSAQDVTVYILASGGFKSFWINPAEAIAAEDLDALLDTLQETLPGKVAVIYDACSSGSFLSALIPPSGKERILISSASADQSSYFLADGRISFSNFFWAQILNGSDLYRAFVHAKNAMWYVSQGMQTAQLDDTGNGIGNEKIDGSIARYYTLGTGIMLAGDDPLIGSVSPEQSLSGESTALIWAKDVTTTGAIDRVWAVIAPPGSSPVSPDVPVTDLPSVDLVFNAGSGRWEGAYTGFAVYGTYGIAIYAMDALGNISLPSASKMVQTVGPDVYEVDDTFSSAKVITLNAVDAQRHTFHDAGDQDWVMFYGVAGETYEMRTENLGSRADTVIIIHDTNGATPLTDPNDMGDDFGYGEGELLSWQCPTDGIYYVKIRQYDPADFGADTEYDLRIYHPVGAGAGMLIGRVLDPLGNGINGALIKALNINTTAISLTGGYYLMVLPVGTYSLTAQIPGYPASTRNDVVIGAENHAALNFTIDMVLKGDISGDINMDLADAILALEVLSGMDATGQVRPDYGASGADVNGDGKVGIEEVIYILQDVVELRTQ